MEGAFKTFAGASGVADTQLSPAQRLAELGDILAAGVIRMLAPKSSEQSPDSGECSLDFAVARSGPELQTDPENTPP